jgi:hypothetical protein
MPVYKFRRTALINMAVTNPVGGVIYYSNADNTTAGFNLTYVPAYTEFTNLFDQYRIKAVRCTWRPTASEVPVGADLDHQLPNLWTVIDQNDGTVPSAATTLSQYQSLKISRLDRPVTRTFYPRIAQSAYASGAVSGYSFSDGPQWCDTGSPGVQHYGAKWALVWPGAGAGTVAQYISFTMEYELEFRCVR